MPSKSKPVLPSLASMRALNLPPSRRSTSLSVVCQSSWAAFHCLMSSGLFQASQTLAIGALTAVSTVIFTVVSYGFRYLLLVARGGASSTFIYAWRDELAARGTVAGRLLGARGLQRRRIECASANIHAGSL